MRGVYRLKGSNKESINREQTPGQQNINKTQTVTDSMQTEQPNGTTTVFRKEGLLPVNLAKSLHNCLQLVGWVEGFQAVCADHVLDFGLQGSLNV